MLSRPGQGGEKTSTKAKGSEKAKSSKITSAASIATRNEGRKEKTEKAQDKYEITKSILKPIGQLVESIEPGRLKLLLVDVLKFVDPKLPYTLIGKGSPSSFFIKEFIKDKFCEKKIDHISGTVVSGLSKILTGIEKKRDPKASNRIVKTPLGSGHILNFMTMTYLEE